MDARRSAGPEGGSEGRRGFRERGFWRGLEETVDLKNKGLGGERGLERERWEREEIWEGILRLFGEKRDVVVEGGGRKWVGRSVEREREIEAVFGRDFRWVFWSSGVCESGFWEIRASVSIVVFWVFEVVKCLLKIS